MYQRHYEEKAGFYKEASSLLDDEAATAAAAAKAAKAQPVVRPNDIGSRVKVSCLVSPEPTESELLFLVQMGVTHVFTWISNEQSTLEFVAALKAKVNRHGLTLWNVGNRHLGKSPHTILATEHRDRDIGAFQAFIRMLGEAGVGITTFTWEADGVWNTHTGVTRGGIVARACDAGMLARLPLSKEREYEEEELWTNLEYFLGKILPVCEEAGVRLALHPNDPPLPSVAGVPCLIRNKAAYERVFSAAKDHPSLGMEFCCGCWLEGGPKEGGFGNIFTALPDFVRRGKVFIVHLRNVTSPLPTFTETYIDGGYGDMYRIMRTLTRADYDGTVILDHTPPFEASVGEGAPTAFAIGYMKASLRAAHAEMVWARAGEPSDDGLPDGALEAADGGGADVGSAAGSGAGASRDAT